MKRPCRILLHSSFKKTMASTEASLGPARGFIEFVNASPTPFHAVHESVIRLEKAGFKRLSERDSWSNVDFKAGSKYYVTRNQSSIIAFAIPEFKKGTENEARGMSIVGCHTDSPRFLIRPISRREKGGFAQVAVETYGGGIWATWLDRDLGIAGRVTLKNTTNANKDGHGEYTNHLLLHRQPIMRMPTIAIHLERTQNEKFHYNPETQQVPILALANKTLNESFVAEHGGSAEVSFADPLAITSHHHPILMHTIANALTADLGEEITPSQIHDFELSLFDVQPSTIGGALNEFIFSPRLDNLFSSYGAVTGLIESVSSPNWSTDSDGRVSMIALFDHEEVGSVSTHGAQSNFIESIIERVSACLKPESESVPEAYSRTLSRSYLLSTDMGHSLHPGFLGKHEENHRPLINSGPAIKTNAQQRYASTSQTTFALRRVAKLGGVKLQEYEVRNDMGCGSTIGPLVSKIGLRTVDIGCPQLSMHSCREQGGCQDMASLIQLFKIFFEKFGDCDDLKVD